MELDPATQAFADFERAGWEEVAAEYSGETAGSTAQISGPLRRRPPIQLTSPIRARHLGPSPFRRRESTIGAPARRDLAEQGRKSPGSTSTTGQPMPPLCPIPNHEPPEDDRRQLL